jgi:hypothetical protein
LRLEPACFLIHLVRTCQPFRQPNSRYMTIVPFHSSTENPPGKSVWQCDFRLVSGPSPALVENQRDGYSQEYSVIFSFPSHGYIAHLREKHPPNQSSLTTYLYKCILLVLRVARLACFTWVGGKYIFWRKITLAAVQSLAMKGPVLIQLWTIWTPNCGF